MKSLPKTFLEYMNPYPNTLVDEATGQIFEDKEYKAWKNGWDARGKADLNWGIHLANNIEKSYTIWKKEINKEVNEVKEINKKEDV